MITVISVLRWIAVLPGALLAAQVVNLTTLLICCPTFNMMASDSDSFLPRFLETFSATMVRGAAIAYALVCTGTWIAPSKKTTTRMLLSIMLAMISGLAFVIFAIMANELFEKYELMRPVPGDELIVYMAGIMFGMFTTSIAILVMAWRGNVVFGTD